MSSFDSPLSSSRSSGRPVSSPSASSASVDPFSLSLGLDDSSERLDEQQFYKLMRSAFQENAGNGNLSASFLSSPASRGGGSGLSAVSDESLKLLWAELPKSPSNTISLSVLSQILAGEDSDSNPPSASSSPPLHSRSAAPSSPGPSNPPFHLSPSAFSPVRRPISTLDRPLATPGTLAFASSRPHFSWLDSIDFLDAAAIQRGFQQFIGRKLKNEEFSQIEAILTYKRIDRISRDLFIAVILDLRPECGKKNQLQPVQPDESEEFDPVISFARVLQCTDLLPSLPFLAKNSRLPSTLFSGSASDASSAQVEELQRQKRELEIENSRLHQSIETLEQRLSQSDDSHGRLNSLVESLKSEVRAVRLADQANQDKVESLRSEASAAQAARADILRQFDESRAALAEAKTRIASLMSERSQSSERIESLRKQLEEAQKSAEKEKSISESEQEKRIMSDKQKAELADLQRQREIAAAKAIEEANAAIDELRRELELSRAENERLGRQVSELESENRQFAKLRDAEQSQSSLNKYLKTKAENKSFDSLEEELNHSTEENADAAPAKENVNKKIAAESTASESGKLAVKEEKKSGKSPRKGREKAEEKEKTKEVKTEEKKEEEKKEKGRGRNKKSEEKKEKEKEKEKAVEANAAAAPTAGSAWSSAAAKLAAAQPQQQTAKASKKSDAKRDASQFETPARPTGSPIVPQSAESVLAKVRVAVNSGLFQTPQASRLDPMIPAPSADDYAADPLPQLPPDFATSSSSAADRLLDILNRKWLETKAVEEEKIRQKQMALKAEKEAKERAAKEKAAQENAAVTEAKETPEEEKKSPASALEVMAGEEDFHTVQRKPKKISNSPATLAAPLKSALSTAASPGSAKGKKKAKVEFATPENSKKTPAPETIQEINESQTPDSGAKGENSSGKKKKKKSKASKEKENEPETAAPQQTETETPAETEAQKEVSEPDAAEVSRPANGNARTGQRSTPQSKPKSAASPSSSSVSPRFTPIASADSADKPRPLLALLLILLVALTAFFAKQFGF